MAKLYVTEFSNVLDLVGGPIQIAATPPIVDQTPVTIGVGSLSSAAFNAATRFVRLHTDAVCSVAFGTLPTATANNMRMAANQTEYFKVNAGDSVAVIQNS